MRKRRIGIVGLTSIASSAITDSYKAINSGGLPESCCCLRITNDSNKIVTVSFDGTNDHEVVRKTDYVTLIDDFKKGTVVYVKGSADGNFVYLSGYYHDKED